MDWSREMGLRVSNATISNPSWGAGLNSTASQTLAGALTGNAAVVTSWSGQTEGLTWGGNSGTNTLWVGGPMNDYGQHYHRITVRSQIYESEATKMGQKVTEKSILLWVKGQGVLETYDNEDEALSAAKLYVSKNETEVWLLKTFKRVRPVPKEVEVLDA